MNLIEAIHDNHLLRPCFGPDLSTWSAHLVVAKAARGIPLDRRELKLFRKLSQRRRPPRRPVRTLVENIGRRGGKTKSAAATAIDLAFFRDYSMVLSRGERGVVLMIAADRRQARVALEYIVALIDSTPMLADRVERRTAEAIDIRGVGGTAVSLEVAAANFRTIRGRTILGAVLDEVAFWRDENSANPDKEIWNALLPGMASVPNAMACMISTPHAQAGLFFELVRDHFGKESDDILVVMGDTRTFNPLIDRSVIDKAYAEDPAVAASEYGRDGQIFFRSDLEGWIDRAAIMRCVIPGRGELPPQPHLVGSYVSFCDPSGGGPDYYAVSIAHRERDRVVVDVVRERGGGSINLAETTREFAEIAKSYGCRLVVGDRYSAGWCASEWEKNGVSYRPSDLSKSEIYGTVLAALNTGMVELPDDAKLISQFSALERRVRSGGADLIDHPRGGARRPGERGCGRGGAGEAADRTAHGGCDPCRHRARLDRRESGVNAFSCPSRRRVPVGPGRGGPLSKVTASRGSCGVDGRPEAGIRPAGGAVKNPPTKG